VATLIGHSEDARGGLEMGAAALNELGLEADLVAHQLARRSYQLAKRTLDVVVAAGLLLAVSWLLLLVALAVRLDSPGPILFWQTRIGRGGRPFKMVKFRTMRRERRLRRGAPPPGVAERRVRHKGARDPRVTRLGRLLRRTCVDELPQLWNVLRGEMSLVGPRPELPEIVARYEPWQHARHLVTPGITGWWQVNRDAARLMHEATELDLHYVRHQSFWLDLVILVRTARAVLSGAGAF
jgi:lipopolysaccharide/colanic/teichoic acid biosynthesis glycosyltransferase